MTVSTNDLSWICPNLLFEVISYLPEHRDFMLSCKRICGLYRNLKLEEWQSLFRNHIDQARQVLDGFFSFPDEYRLDIVDAPSFLQALFRGPDRCLTLFRSSTLQVQRVSFLVIEEWLKRIHNGRPLHEDIETIPLVRRYIAPPRSGRPERIFSLQAGTTNLDLQTSSFHLQDYQEACWIRKEILSFLPCYDSFSPWPSPFSFQAIDALDSCEDGYPLFLSRLVVASLSPLRTPSCWTPTLESCLCAKEILGKILNVHLRNIACCAIFHFLIKGILERYGPIVRGPRELDAVKLFFCSSFPDQKFEDFLQFCGERSCHFLCRGREYEMSLWRKLQGPPRIYGLFFLVLHRDLIDLVRERTLPKHYAKRVLAILAEEIKNGHLEVDHPLVHRLLPLLEESAGQTLQEFSSQSWLGWVEGQVRRIAGFQSLKS